MMSSGQIVALKTSVARKYNDLLRARSRAIGAMSETNQNHILTEVDVNLSSQLSRMSERELFLGNAPEGDTGIHETGQMLFEEKQALIKKYSVPISPNASINEVRNQLLITVDPEIVGLEKKKVHDKDEILLCDDVSQARAILDAIPEVETVPVTNTAL
jgi:hypothetical protein